jgi:ER membrane protein SH3
MLANAPRIIGVMLHAVIGVGVMGHLVKLYKANESNYLFDGASLVLYMVSVVLYGTSVRTGILVQQIVLISRNKKCEGTPVWRYDKGGHIKNSSCNPRHPRGCSDR